LFLEKAEAYFANGRKIPTCKIIDRETSLYFDEQDLVGQFLTDSCTLGAELFTKKTELYSEFSSWCDEEQGLKKPMSSRKFYAELEKRGLTERVKFLCGKTLRCIIGVALKGKSYNITNKPDFPIPTREKRQNETNMKIENSCNVVRNSPSQDGSRPVINTENSELTYTDTHVMSESEYNASVLKELGYDS
jgi:hypothetical protein